MIDTSFNLNSHEYQIYITDRVDRLSDEWNGLVNDNVYLRSSYLGLLEQHGPLGYHYYYALTKKDGIPVGITYFQRKVVDLSKDFRIHSHSKNIFAKLRVQFLKWFFRFLKSDLLIMGNVLLTGEYAFHFSQDVNQRELNHILEITIKEVKAFIWNHSKRKIKTTLIKDFYTGDTFKKMAFNLEGFTEFHVQPDMIIKIRDDWSSYDDFLSSVKSKYRVKFKKVVSKSKTMEFREMDTDQLKIHNDAMYALYEATADRALFSLFKLSNPYFRELKSAMPDAVTIYGVFLENRLVGFYTFIQNGDFGDAHFLGYDVTLNSKHQLYFNILLRLINLAILKKVKYLNLSRTALEIKSSVGAEPYDMNIYMNYHQSFLNARLPWILDKIVPKNNWQQRSPFK